ncbi:MAG: class I SAM-dependent methyltransferase, partial [Candidatus Krumholzibacteria bacterium]|nr:class I SAM-dependent methyltransferase [Candidatus Krumholzibacteria bacterium]
MSFTPLPKTFTDLSLNQDLPFPRILEFGCGDGRFREVLTDRGIFSWGLDRMGRPGGTVADVVGDALFPPVASGSLDFLLAANLVRHLAPVDPTLGFLTRWLELLNPGGCLFIFEDEPGHSPAGVAHYGDLQDFLFRLMPESRGPLLPLAEFKTRVSTLGFPAGWDFGLVRNRQAIDATVVLEMLG